MPVHIYFDFLGRLPDVSREHAVLTNSHSQRIAGRDYDVETLCEVRAGELLLESAKRLCPQAVPYIEKALASVPSIPLQ